VSTLKVNNVEDLGADPVVTNGVIAKAAFPAGTILQVVSTDKTDTFTTTSTTYTAVTGLSATITPRSTDSKILIVTQITHGFGNSTGFGHFKVTGGNTSSYVGVTAGSRIAGVFGGLTNETTPNISLSGSIVYLDSPATTSAVTYGVEVRQALTGSVVINRSVNDSDGAQTTRGASSITLMEVAG
jgi:hypothetical protein